jgi:A nuclease family of the HNH/ENDO VII superfamily with conserved AHH
VSTSGCAVGQLRVNMNPKNTPLNADAKARINKDYGGKVNNNLYEDIVDADWMEGSRSTKPKETSPHHITPKKEFEKTRCFRAQDGIDVCQGARDILDRVGMSYNDGCNGAFLPYSKGSPIHGTYPNAQIHNRTDFHDLKYYSRLFDILTDAETKYDNPALGLKKLAKKAKLCEELQVIAYRLLTDQFH